ncbi:hypothetical protein FEM48_Zijuj07G0165400 [Ziziphus jujuba var. spinosa]|uniref:Disease resistance protein At4g27220 n=1 Tax=Ziziphus jujuba var. spinosa TaxID=714518 RepID=A0A978V5Q7_ZIZJJ|nr:hypothetical protein FEM48_Zijuj07G0165400 [Ziziphus jujuba var. spinosa]
MSYKISRSKAGEDSLVLPRDVHSLHFNIMMMNLELGELSQNCREVKRDEKIVPNLVPLLDPRPHNTLTSMEFSSLYHLLQNFRIHKLRGDIAKTIGLDLGNDDDERRRAAKKIGCEEYIKVEPITEKEAWELFTGKLGHDRTFAPQIEPIAKPLAKKCSGLPLGIITMAGCMRDVEDITEWNDTLERMKGSIVEHDDDMGIEVFQLKEIPREEKWAEDLTKVSLMNNDISYIPSVVSPKCRKLSTLMLNNNIELRNISDCFFRHMLQLSVLDLSFTDIEILPMLISGLVNLTALLLNGCMALEFVPSLANVKALRRLNLSRTSIAEVPQGLEMLLNLRYLDLERTNIKMIPDGILPKLYCLQYLAILKSWSCTSTVRGEDTVKLRKLETFKGKFYSIDDFNTFARCRENIGGPNNYLLLVGLYFISVLSTPLVLNYDRAVCLKECNISKSKAGEDSLVLPKDVQTLYIEHCDDFSNLCDIASLKTATKTERFDWERDMLCICIITSIPNYHISSLKEFVIIGCPKIKRLFRPVFLSHLKHLQALRVEDCEEIVEMIGDALDDDENQEPGCPMLSFNGQHVESDTSLDNLEHKAPHQQFVGFAAGRRRKLIKWKHCKTCMEYIETAMSIVEGVINYEGIDEKMKKLKRKLKHLRSREEDVKEELKHAEGLSLKKPRKVVENWLKNVGNIKNQVEQMEQQIQETRWFSHLPLERKMGMLTEQVAELDQQGQFPEGLTLEAHGSQHVKFITTKLIGQTFQEHKDVIWECLRSNNVSKIGIYGMGGVGKTTLLIDIHNELLDHPNFSVSWVTASQEFRIHKLQNDIAKTIKLELENDDDGRKRAAQLAWHLRNMNNFVLILDDVWQHFPLDRVGIPTGGNGCKLILTSRSLEVCRRIGCEEHIKVQPLSEKDAWELFTEKLGHETLSHEIEPIAKLLAKKCSGLPLGIITMAGCMREVEDISEWSDALGKMNESVVEHDDNMSTEVFQVLKYSYDRLKDPKVKQCFLYCSLFPEDFEIERETLVEYFIDERLVDGMRSRQAELNRGLAILNKLENVCLLEGIVKANGKRYVKMHDLVRSMAIKIAKVNSPILVKAGEQLKEIPAEEKWSKDFIKVSLMENNISDIPDSVSPNCPKLSTLMLNHNHCLRSIPDCFFSYMPQLSVLDLSYTHIENLPTSISDLVNLTALRLEGCMRLQHIPSLANLKVLRRLNLSLTGITEVPQGMEMLFNLRYLNLDGTGIKMIPDCIFAKLSCLQYLGIDNVITISSKLKVRGVEMVKLRKLETLKGQLYDMEDFNAYVRWRENNGGPNNYLLQVGQYFLSHSSLMKTYDRAVCLKECKISKSKGGEDSLVLPTDVQFLHIRKCNDASSLCDIASLNNATQLRDCEIHICEGMENMVCCCSCSLPLLQSLQSLWLFGLSKLRALIGGEICCASKSASPSSKLLLQTAMFSSLTRLQIFDCPKLKRLFTPVLLSNLKHLEVLTVEKCEQMVEIIGEASDESDDCINQQEPISSTSIILALPKLSNLRQRMPIPALVEIDVPGLRIENEDDERKRAAKLACSLRIMNNFVLILDDVWQHFELDRVGIPTNGKSIIRGCMSGVEDIAEWSDALEKLKALEARHGDDMGTEIARVNQSFLVKAGERLRDIPGGEKWEENLTKVSLMENSKSTIPTCGSAKFPRLTILTLNGNRQLEIIPDCFFNHMPALHVLDLSYTDIENLPTSIGDLVNLTALWLVGIRIEMIPDGILPKLSCLQYLGILALEKGTLIVRGEGVVKLGNLETFQMESYDIHDFNTYARWQKNNKGATKNYLLLVGPCRAYELSRYGVEKYESSELSPDGENNRRSIRRR